MRAFFREKKRSAGYARDRMKLLPYIRTDRLLSANDENVTE